MFVHFFSFLILMPISEPWRFRFNWYEWDSGTWSFKNTPGGSNVQTGSKFNDLGKTAL